MIFGCSLNIWLKGTIHLPLLILLKEEKQPSLEQTLCTVSIKKTMFGPSLKVGHKTV